MDMDNSVVVAVGVGGISGINVNGKNTIKNLKNVNFAVMGKNG